MKNKFKKNIPNIITLTRIIALVLGFIYFAKNEFTISICFYIYGAISDALDGYLARRLDAYSKLGQYLDAISDKVFSLSILLLVIIYGNKLVISIILFELIIAIINLLILAKKKKVFTERIAKFKTTFVFISLIVALIEIKVKPFIYLLVPLLILSIYFEVQSILAYINQLNGKSKEKVINLIGKPVKEKIRLLLNEFKYYLLNPVKIIK